MVTADLNDLNPEYASHTTQLLTSFGLIDNPASTETFLANRSFYYSMTGSTIETLVTDPFQYNVNTTATGKYTSKRFYGMVIDTGASNRSTAGYGQFLAYQKHVENIDINKATAGALTVQFGIGSTSLIGSISLATPVGQVEFHIVYADTPFILCLRDMDNLRIQYNNLDNTIVFRDNHRQPVPVLRRFGYTFVLQGAQSLLLAESFDYNPCLLSETELRQLHRRFGHLSVNRFYKVLERLEHDVNRQAIQHITKFCSFCQKHGKSPGRFKFVLQAKDKDICFNHAIFVDIMYIENSPILHVIDEATKFQAARWLKNILAKHTQEVLRYCWINTYNGPPDSIVHDAGTNFTAKEFTQNATSLAIVTKCVLVEAHWSVGVVERYHVVIRRAFSIITTEIPDIGRDIALQMAVKAVNDTAGPDGLVLTLLVFGAYPRMDVLDPLAPLIT